MIKARLKRAWTLFWLNQAGMGPGGRFAARLAGWFYPPYKGRHALARLCARGYISPHASVRYRNLSLGQHIFIGDGVILFSRDASGAVVIGDAVAINKDTIIEQGDGGSLNIGARTTIQPRCQISAYTGPIRIGEDVQIGPGCAFYPYNHGMSVEQSMQQQPLVTRGGIVIEDDVWLGYGVIVLDGVRIGAGAVIGAGSVVTADIPPGAVAAGVPARVIRLRNECLKNHA
ncbi:MAG: acyltransferase [Thiogranum sp.]|nr:acyltransferase [Thiogranum sp.]